ncbi:hypothetical protein [Streptomyces sp. RerS4]|uniref:hypothetical protein n=1 Tax=Streptomyces sp. RerS4 TaxID=2942449 RepID=UPI00201C6014|nr:hypothetical protein [Streptomyces sp. RerS4]UQX03633.1 hypothetical protein M4D82_26405 [Streptomyces sp. RerS4]
MSTRRPLDTGRPRPTRRHLTLHPARHPRSAPPPPDALITVDLDTDGWLLSHATGRRVRADRLADHLSGRLSPPPWATDIIVHVHGWQTSPASAVRGAQRLLTLMSSQRGTRAALYPRLREERWAPWTVVVRWPSSSLPTQGGYERIRQRAHTMSTAGTGYAPHVLGHLLGYLHTERGNPKAKTLQTRDGRYLHLIGHSFGGRFLCEAVTRAADAAHGSTLGWSTATHPSRPFTVDSLTVFQMAAPRTAFDSTFRRLRPGPLGHTSPVGGPMVFTHSRHDRATGFWHLLGEGRSGIGHSGMRLTSPPGEPLPTEPTAAPDVWSTRLLRADTPYPLTSLDHTFVNVDASWRYRSTRINPVGAHSDFYHPESAHLLLSLAEHSRPAPT